MLKQELQLKQALSPRQIIEATLLQLNNSNLEKIILEELEKNPILEPAEIVEEVQNSTDSEDVNNEDWEDDYEPANIYEPKKDKKNIPIPDQTNFLEKLIDQLNEIDLAGWERSIAEEIIYNLDEHGYLSVDLFLIADRFGKDASEIEHILSVVQHFDPPGLGSRNLQECLMIQLDNDKSSIPYKIIRDYFDDFVNKRYNRICEKGRISNNDLSAVIDVVSKLNPRPGEGSQITKDDTIIPDLIVNKRSNQWEIIVNDNWIPSLRISKIYHKMTDDLDSQTTKTKKFLKHNYNSAKWFIQAVEQRRETLVSVMNEIINRQSEFFKGNIEELRPMKLQDIAESIDMDISTVSRATRGKYVETPYGIYELKYYFTESITLNDGKEISTHQVKLALKELIKNEDKHNPISDEELKDKLKKLGYPVARRTVAKYRDQLQLPVARLRKEL
ncbi:MAG: RNA polymerase factor sigma-54 [Candidatus Neomarinimicrobiota bacterium]|nr:RNA polymerase factor sigma-54 [Candidatus Neomarinimicrobiota bacterium]